MIGLLLFFSILYKVIGEMKVIGEITLANIHKPIAELVSNTPYNREAVNE